MVSVSTWYATTVLGLPIYVTLWLFLLYSCAGVVVEGVFCFVLTGRLEFRSGLLYLPLRPIYGFGGTACTLFLTPLLNHPVVIFALGAVICTVIEFVASWVIEGAFRTNSWDYSDKHLNLHGRICLQYSLCWDCWGQQRCTGSTSSDSTRSSNCQDIPSRRPSFRS